jgi:hypothetical protein
MSSGPKLVGRNQAGQLYGLTAMCPIINVAPAGLDRSRDAMVRATLADLPLEHESMFATIDNVYMARFYVLRDVFYESKPARTDHLKSAYLVFVCHFHGERDPMLWQLWDHATEQVKTVWQHCVGFEDVANADDFVTYIRRCQLTNALLFNGSTDQPLAEQLKGLYLKQEFGAFVADHQHLPAAELKQAFSEFVQRVEVDNLARPTWRAGAATLDSVWVG